MRFLTFLQGLGIAALLTLPTAIHAQKGTDQVVEVVFTSDMDKTALERIKEDVKAKGVLLTYDVTDFKAGQLHHIAFSVTTPAGSGKAEGDIKPDVRYGFRYDPRPGAEVPFSVGSLNRGVEEVTEPPMEKR